MRRSLAAELPTHVLMTDNGFQDFFYVCPSHLKDSNFCTPVIDKAAIEARKKKAMEEELERVKKEYEEKQKKKKEKEQEKEKEKDKDGDAKEKDKDKAKSGDKTKSSTDDKVRSTTLPLPWRASI